jgi:hypothetical protein
MFDAAGSRRIAVTGAAKALDFGLGPVQAIILGTITRVGGGTLRDVLIRRVPVVLNSELYAIPALVAAAVIVVCESLDVPTQPSAVGAAALCFAIRMTGVRYGLKAPGPRGFDAPDPDPPQRGVPDGSPRSAPQPVRERPSRWSSTVPSVCSGSWRRRSSVPSRSSRCAVAPTGTLLPGSSVRPASWKSAAKPGWVRIEELTDEFAAGTAEVRGAPRTSKGVPVLSMNSHREPGRTHDRMVH